MICYLVSNLKNYEKIDGVKYPKEIDNTNGIVDQLKDDITDSKGLLMIASDPADIEKTNYYLDLMKKSLLKSNISFDSYESLTNETKDRTQILIDNASFIVLGGGHTYTQKKFFDEIKLDKLLKNFNGVILGISAGTVNMAKDVFNSPECYEDLNDEQIYTGLGFTNINAEPHFVLDDSSFEEGEVIQRNSVLKESFNRRIIGLPDVSHIRNNTLYGLGYEIKDGNIKQICESGKSTMI